MSAKLEYLKRYMPSQKEERRKRKEKLIEKLEASTQNAIAKQA